MSEVIVKQATINDLEKTFEIVNEASLWPKEKYGFTHWLYWYTLEVVKQNFDHKTVYLLYEDSIPVATYTMSIKPPSYYTDKELSYFNDPKTEAYYLTTLCVKPTHQGKGYAKMLIKHLEGLSKEKNIEYVRFDAREDYTELINFYKKQGYQIVGKVEDDSGDDNYVLFEKKIL